MLILTFTAINDILEGFNHDTKLQRCQKVDNSASNHYRKAKTNVNLKLFAVLGPHER